MRSFYLIMAIVGTVVPWAFFGGFFVANGFDIPAFARGLFANGAAGGFSADVLISILVFWVWSYGDARANAVPNWWWVLPSGCFVGLSLALPLYLWLRASAIDLTEKG